MQIVPMTTGEGSMEFESKNENYNKILSKYIDYLHLYKLMNNGSIENATSFEDFYWELVFHGEYRENSQISRLS